MIELFEQNERKIDRQSSKGNQLKWENDSIWYKADQTGYEGLAEYIVSHLLEKSTLQSGEFVLYDLEEIKYKSKIYRGARSQNLLKDDWQIVTLERLVKNFTGESLYKTIFQIREHENRMKYLVTLVERITGLQGFGIYMSKLFTIDAFFLNEDRHMHNIAVLMNGAGEFAYCPIFDNGAALLSDTTMDYPMEDDVYELMNEAESKTISFDFDEQLDIAEALYGDNLKFSFTRQEVHDLLEGAAIYTKEERDRVERIICAQMHKYTYLF